MYCHKGCSTEDVLLKVGLKMSDLFNDEKQNIKPHVVAEYVYSDEEGKPLYKAIRYEPKEFRQARLENGEWIWKMTGFDNYVPYNLPNVVKSEEIYFVEGEKDADNLNSIGLCATTTVSGAKRFNKYAQKYATFFKNKTVYIIPDNDEAGESYAKDIVTALEPVTKKVKIIQLKKLVPDLKQKGDVSDVLMKYGKEKTLEILEELTNDEINVSTMTVKDIISVKFFKTVNDLEDNERQQYLDVMDALEEKLERKDFMKFKREYKKYCEDKKKKEKQKSEEIKEQQRTEIWSSQAQGLFFDGLNENIYNSTRYIVNNFGHIFENNIDKGPQLVSYQPIIPIEILNNIEDGTYKVKLAFKERGRWKELIVNQSDISTTQGISKLSDYGIEVESGRAGLLMRYLSEIKNLNIDKIPQIESVSRFGWFDGVLIPYSDKFQFDKIKENPRLENAFEEKGTLEEWCNFFREKRKYNKVARILMAASISSIILKKIKQPGYTVHIHGTTEFGKTVACMAAESIFGNPDDIGINFNTTLAGLESKLNMYNNLPLFINEMQHQKDASSYDKLLFLVAEGHGKTRSTKGGGNARDNNWQNVAITNGEKDIVKENSDGGAYNRVLSFELKDYSYENLPEVADFSREHYGTAIREILKHLDNFDLEEIYKEKLEELQTQETSNKQKIIKALLMVGDVIVTDILFKDELYLTAEDFAENNINKNEIAVETRAYGIIKEWCISSRNHFEIEDKDIEIKEPLVGKMFGDGYVAFLKNELSKKLAIEGFDANQIYSGWKRKGYTKCEGRRVTSRKIIKNEYIPCIVLNMRADEDIQTDFDYDIPEDMPF